MSWIGNLRNLFYDYVVVPFGFGNQTERTSRADSMLPDEVRIKWEREQEELKKKVVLKDDEQLINMLQFYDKKDFKGQTFYVAGVDISFVKDDDVNACAALVVLTYPDLKIIYEDYKMVELTAPYIPGFLGFREAPFIVDLFDELKRKNPEYLPHVVMVDGNGILHPKEFGSACHMGVCLDVPCIGVAKKLFQVGGLEKNDEHSEKIKGLNKGGDTFPLIVDSGRTLGMALRSCENSRNPVYVSPGHCVTMETAVRLVHSCCNVRVPEPVRMADMKSREYIRQNFKPSNQKRASDKPSNQKRISDKPSN